METSDESFVWTDASSDSSTKIEEEMKQNTSQHDSNNHDMKRLNLEEDVQVEQKRSKKRKKEATREEPETNNIDFYMNTSIKSEPNSDFDVPKSKKRKRNHEIGDCNGTLQEAENYLNLRVKQEQVTFVEPTPRKSKKRKKCKSESENFENGESQYSTQFKNENDYEDYDLNKSFLNNCEDSKIVETDNIHGKKKKKKKSVESPTLETQNRTDLDISENTNKIKRKTVKRKSYSSKELIEDNSGSDNGEIISSTLINNSVNAPMNMHNIHKHLSSTVNQISIIEGPLKSSKISDRIRFEEEDSIDFESNENVSHSNLSNQLKQFISLNSNMKALQCSLANSGITEDDEIWILKAPYEIPVSSLENCDLTLDGKKKVKVNGKNYDIILDDSSSIVPIQLCQKKTFIIKKIPLMGVISLCKRLPKVHIPYETLSVNTEASFITLPDTKCRHPLFVSNYKKATKIRPDIAERLRVTESSNYAENMEKKRKKLKKKEKIEVESEIEVKPNVEVVDSKRKKKKRKHSYDDFTPQKKKRIKKDLSCADAWESEQAIEENLFNF